jgi:transcriptional regulator
MGKSHNRQRTSIAGKMANEDEHVDDSMGTGESSADNSPQKKKTKSSEHAEEEQYDSMSELDEDELKIAKYITKNVSSGLGKLIADNITLAMTPFHTRLEEVAQTANEAMRVAVAAEEEIARVERKADEKIDAVEKAAQEKIAAAEQTANKAQKTAMEALEMATNLGKTVSELESKLRSGASTGACGVLASAVCGSECGSVLFEDTAHPSAKASDRLKKLFHTYSTSVQAAKTTRTFILGRKKGETPPTQAAAKLLMECFFPDVGCIITKTDKAKVAKVYVPKPEEAQQLKFAIKNTWAALGSQGWWLREDVPEQLGKLETRAREFFKAAKASDPTLEKKIGFVNIEYGVVSKDGKELLPLFLIPLLSARTWPTLFQMMADRIDTLSDNAFLGDYVALDDEAFFLRWIDAAGLSKLADDVRIVRENMA